MALSEEAAATAAVSEEAATSAAAAATIPTQQNATGGSPWTAAPGSTGGTPWTPVASSAQAVPPGLLKIPILIDWWLEKVEDEEGKIGVAGFTFTPQMMNQILRKGASSSKGHKNKKLARRILRSKAIVKQYDLSTIEDEDGHRIKIGALLNTTKTRENGFSEKVCECFYFGFTDMWQKVINPEMVPDNEHAQSPSETTTGAPSASVEDYIAYFLSDSFSSSFKHDISVTDNNFDSFVVGYSGKTDGLTTQSLWNLPDDNAGNITSGLHGLKMHVPEKPLAPPGEACNCVQAEEHDDIPQWNMHSCSSGHGMVTLPTDRTSSQLGEPGIPKSGKDSVNLGTTDALELPTEGMTPKFGAIGGSEESTGIRLRSGRVLEMSSGGPMKSGHKQKKIQLDASSKQMVFEFSSKQMVNQGATSTADLTSHEHDFSAAEVVVEEKLESQDSCRKGRGIPRKGDKKRKRE